MLLGCGYTCGGVGLGGTQHALGLLDRLSGAGLGCGETLGVDDLGFSEREIGRGHLVGGIRVGALADLGRGPVGLLDEAGSLGSGRGLDGPQADVARLDGGAEFGEEGPNFCLVVTLADDRELGAADVVRIQIPYLAVERTARTRAAAVAWPPKGSVYFA
ncbi:unannotated protein [freshwater metagenome]|uniref:Unannotated protein n=1 Tax=freshwater metagenome TaxID=449393 RepID=A0A6J7R2B2_9ZZZZ